MSTRNNLSTYLDLCTEYYDLDKPTAPPDALRFYMLYAQKARGPILEPMCGTGNYLIPILEAGYEIEGFDASPSMLKVLESKCIAKKLKPNVWQQFLQDIDIKKKYALIIIPSGSFSLITDPLDIKQSLQKIFQHLEQGGTFVFEVETIHSIPAELGIWQGSMQMRSDGNMIIASFLSCAPVNTIGTFIGRYDLVEKNMLIKTEIERYKLHLYTVNEMTVLLQETGFKSIQALKPYNMRVAATEDDESIVFECTK